MAPRVKSTDFSKLFESSHKELYSEKFYEAMDMGSEDLHNYDPFCNNILVYRKYKEKIIPICKKYLRFLHTSKSWGDVESYYDVSFLLNYWLYDKLKNIYPEETDDEINVAFSALQLIWGRFDGSRSQEPYYKKCKPELSIVDHKDWKNRKKLYDYYVDSTHLVSLAKVNDNKCEYYKKIEEKKSLYEHFERECLTEKNCPVFYDQCKPYKPDNVLPNLLCYAQMQKQITDAEAPGHSSEDGRAPSGFQRDSTSTQEIPSTSESSDIRRNVTHSVLGAAPVLLTATMLYRYTPLGPWIRRFGGGRTNSMNAMDTFSPYTEETGNMFPEDTANYISYQPI